MYRRVECQTNVKPCMLTIFKVQQNLNFEWKFGLSTFSFVVHTRIMNFLQVATEINIIYGAFCVET